MPTVAGPPDTGATVTRRSDANGATPATPANAFFDSAAGPEAVGGAVEVEPTPSLTTHSHTEHAAPIDGDGTPAQGLVICAISGRAENNSGISGHETAIPATVGELLAGVWAPSFPTPEDVTGSLEGFTPAAKWTGAEGPRWRLTVGPGVLQLSTRDYARYERTEQRESERDRIDADLDAAYLVHTGDWPAEGSPQRVIEGWSRKSRSRMIKTFAGLDYGPMFADDPGGLPAMVTLTYPGDWLTVAPNGAAGKRHLRLLRKRFARAWCRPMRQIWKMELQERGAPHFHVYMVTPVHRSKDGRTFKQWLSQTWAEIVNHPDPEQYRRHLAAGTRVDVAEGMRNRDPKRLAVYFAKHGGAKAKEYQHNVPAAWREPGNGPGRFWGYAELELATATVELEPADAIRAARIVRRWARANGTTREELADRVNTRTGVITQRKQRRRIRRLTGEGRGFVTVNDAPAFTVQLARAVDVWNEYTHPLGEGPYASRNPQPAEPTEPTETEHERPTIDRGDMREATAAWLNPMFDVADDTAVREVMRQATTEADSDRLLRLRGDDPYTTFVALDWVRVGQLLRDRLGWNEYPDTPPGLAEDVTVEPRCACGDCAWPESSADRVRASESPGVH